MSEEVGVDATVDVCRVNFRIRLAAYVLAASNSIRPASSYAITAYSH